MAAAGAAGYSALAQLGCIFAPARLETLELSKAARKLVDRCWKGLDPKKVLDTHVHVVGLGVGGTGCFVHEDTDSLLHPIRKLKAFFYKDAAGIHDDERADQLYVKRLVNLVEHHGRRSRALILAFDKNYTEAGKPNLELTEFYTPNDYVFQLAEAHPKLFVPACSVHPYRADALDELRRCRERGALAVKWLPNAMGIDPMSERCDAFYGVLAELGLVLISHTGEEQAVDAEELQKLGNPLRLRRPLDAGVKVVMAHCASLGEDDDLDAKPDADGEYPQAACYDLFRRVLAEEKYAGQVFGEISAMTQFNRVGAPLSRTLRDTQIHGALINGSDYPLPAIDPLIRLGLLEGEGFLDEADIEPLGEIFDYNPLSFDFCLKRCLRWKDGGETKRFADSVFETAKVFGL